MCWGGPGKTRGTWTWVLVCGRMRYDWSPLNGWTGRLGGLCAGAVGGGPDSHSVKCAVCSPGSSPGTLKQHGGSDRGVASGQVHHRAAVHLGWTATSLAATWCLLLACTWRRPNETVVRAEKVT